MTFANLAFLKRFLFDGVTNMSDFGWLDFKITNRCNNNCVYCEVEHDPPSTPEKIPIETIIQTNETALGLGFNFFAFLGGEPSIREGVEDIFLPFTDNTTNSHLLVITNMHKYNKSLYHAFFGTHALSAFLVASIDRLTEPNYKQQNSKNILANLWKIRDLARDYSDLGKRGVQIHSVISRENFNEFPRLIEFCGKNEISLSLAMVEPLRVVKKDPSKYNEFTTEELRQIVHNLQNIKRKSRLEFSNQVLLEYLEQYLSKNLKMHHCMAGNEHVIIDSDGQVYPCLTESYQRGLSFGNIVHEDFKQIYMRMRSFSCHHPLADTCWDHFLWNRLGEHVRRG